MKSSTSEMQDDLHKVIAIIGRNRNLAILDVPHNGTATLLKRLVEHCNNPTLVENSLKEGNNQNSNWRALYMSLAHVSSAEEYVKELAAKLFFTLSDDNDQMAAYADKYLTEFEYDTHSRFDHDGKKRLSIELLLGDQDAQRALDCLLQMAQKICQEKNCRLVICFDKIDYIEQLNDGQEILCWLQMMLSNKNNVIVVTAFDSRNLYKRFTNGIQAKRYEKFKLSVPSQESIKIIVRSYLKDKSPHQPGEDYLERLCQLSESNLKVAIQLADLSILMSNNHFSVSALEEAFNFILNNNKPFYHQQTCALSRQSRQVIKLLASNDSLSNDRDLQRYNLCCEREAFEVKEALINAGILIENGRTIQFVDPIYAHWIRSCYDRGA